MKGLTTCRRNSRRPPKGRRQRMHPIIQGARPPTNWRGKSLVQVLAPTILRNWTNKKRQRADPCFENKLPEGNKRSRTWRISGRTTRNFIIYCHVPNTLSTRGRISIKNKKRQFDQGILIRIRSCFRCNGWSTMIKSPYQRKYPMTVMHFCTGQNPVYFGIRKIRWVQSVNLRCRSTDWTLIITISYNSLA